MKILDAAPRASKRDDRDKTLWFINRKKLLSLSLSYRRRNSLSLCAEIPLSLKPPTALCVRRAELALAAESV
jgi:hypothetical protein